MKRQLVDSIEWFKSDENARESWNKYSLQRRGEQTYYDEEFLEEDWGY